MHDVISHVHSLILEKKSSDYSTGKDAANAAWAAVTVYYLALLPAFVSVILSALIAWTAITAPNRERHTRDLETRKARARLYGRAALAGRRALRTLAYAEKYVERHLNDELLKSDPIERMVSRLDIRRRVIEHFLGHSLRNIELVELLIETSILLQDLRRKMDQAGEDPTVTLRPASRLLHYKKVRRDVLLRRFAAIAKDMRTKDRSLERDLGRVWSAAWFNPFKRDRFFQTRRD